MKLKFITGNSQKFADAYQTFRKEGVCIEQVSLHIPEIQASTAEEVCREKASYVGERLKGIFFVEDSSFHIPALDGFPGIYTRYVLETLGTQGILAAMKGKIERVCFFRSCIIFQDQNGRQHEFVFVREGLFITHLPQQEIIGWSDLWKIIGISSEHKYYAQLDQSQQGNSHRDWQKNNPFKKLIEHIRNNPYN